MKIDKEVYEKISEITGVDYEGMYYKDPDIDYLLVFSEAVNNMLEDMLVEYNRKVEEIEDLKQDIEDNYEPKKIDPYEEYGISINDFI